jgi:hypothetical protein
MIIIAQPINHNIHKTLQIVSKFFLTRTFAFSIKDKFKISFTHEALIILSTNHAFFTKLSTCLSVFASKASTFFSTFATVSFTSTFLFSVFFGSGFFATGFFAVVFLTGALFVFFFCHFVNY